MDFCPTCGMLLQIEPAGGGHGLRFFCPTCPYICPIRTKIVRKRRLVKKALEPGSSGSDNMKTDLPNSDEVIGEIKPKGAPATNQTGTSTARAEIQAGKAMKEEQDGRRAAAAERRLDKMGYNVTPNPEMQQAMKRKIKGVENAGQ